MSEVDLSYPDEQVERLHLESELYSLISERLDETIEYMTLNELREKIKYLKQNYQEINEIIIKRPEGSTISAQGLWDL